MHSGHSCMTRGCCMSETVNAWLEFWITSHAWGGDRAILLGGRGWSVRRRWPYILKWYIDCELCNCLLSWPYNCSTVLHVPRHRTCMSWLSSIQPKRQKNIQLTLEGSRPLRCWSHLNPAPCPAADQSHPVCYRLDVWIQLQLLHSDFKGLASRLTFPWPISSEIDVIQKIIHADENTSQTSTPNRYLSILRAILTHCRKRNISVIGSRYWRPTFLYQKILNIPQPSCRTQIHYSCEVTCQQY